MIVSELIAALSALPPGALVVISKDGEGNEFSPLSEMGWDDHYLADTTWRGELVPAGSDDDAVQCVVLWPTN